MTTLTEEQQTPRRIEVFRAVPLDDITIRAGGDGRTVTAYASVFTPYEVTDQDGHYEERNNPALFNRALSHGDLTRFQVLFNHGMTIQGTPSERYAMPLGVPLEIRPDSRGLLTVTRYSKTPLADEVLQLIQEGAIRAMSWSGRWLQSRRAGTSPTSGLPVIERMEASLREYGPTPFPMTMDAAITSVRSVSSLLADVQALPEQERITLLTQLSATPGDPGASHVDPDPAGGTDTQPPPADPAPLAGPSISQLANDQRRRRVAGRG